MAPRGGAAGQDTTQAHPHHHTVYDCTDYLATPGGTVPLFDSDWILFFFAAARRGADPGAPEGSPTRITFERVKRMVEVFAKLQPSVASKAMDAPLMAAESLRNLQNTTNKTTDVETDTRNKLRDLDLTFYTRAFNSARGVRSRAPP